MVEDEKFFAWLDGELSPEEAARVEAEVAADPRLSRLANEHRAMTSGLRDAFVQVEMTPVPERLRSWIDRNEKVVGIAEVRALRTARKAPPVWAQMAALAATLAVGVFAGNVMSGMFTVGPSESDRGRGRPPCRIRRARERSLRPACQRAHQFRSAHRAHLPWQVRRHLPHLRRSGRERAGLSRGRRLAHPQPVPNTGRPGDGLSHGKRTRPAAHGSGRCGD